MGDETAGSEQVRDFAGRMATVSGPRHSGKTCALVARAVALGERGEPVVVVCATASAARAFGDAVLHRSPVASGSVRATTWSGIAMDIRDGAGRPARRLIGAGGHRRRVAELLTLEATAGTVVLDWPTLHRTLASAIRRREIAAAVLDLQRSWLGHDEIVTHASAVGCGDRWAELARFTERYTVWLDGQGEIDPARLLVDAGLALRTAGGAAAYRECCPHLLVDDHERADDAINRLLTMLAAPPLAVPPLAAPPLAAPTRGARGSVVVAGDLHGARWGRPEKPSYLAQLGRRLDADEAIELAGALPLTASRSLARAHHRSLEADVVVCAVLDAHDRGTAWDDIAVVLPPVGHEAVSTALRRVAHRLDVPLSVPMVAGDDPIVQAFSGVAAWMANGDDSRLAAACAMGMVTGPDDPRLAASLRGKNAAEAVHATWTALAPWLLAHADGDTLDLVTAFHRRATEIGAGLDDGLDARVRSICGRVAVVTPRDIAGRTWPTVIVTRCVDGVWPGRSTGERFFDAALLDGPDVAEEQERSRLEAQEWTRRFTEVVACATERIVAVAAPDPGVLLSRFVEDWAPTPVVLRRPTAAAARPPQLAISPGAAPAFPTRRLRLSATQLDTYENCPLNYQYQYVAGVRGEGSVSASVGTIVHATLESFLLGEDRSLEALLAALDLHWDPAAFAYRPQEADYRTRADGWLQRWWADELPRIAEVIAVEHRFTIEVGPHELTGSIDRVSRDTDGRLEIVDYKTGAAPGGRIDEDNLQLATYHLAATRDPAIAAHGSPDRLRLHYLDSGSGPLPHSGKDIDQPIATDHVERTEARILLTAEAILDEQFEASVDASCDYCSFHRLCPLQPEGREVPVA